LKHYRAFWGLVVGTHSAQNVYKTFGKESHYYDYNTETDLGNYVRWRTRPLETVVVMGRAGTFYLEADRKPATRFICTNPAYDAIYPNQKIYHRLMMEELKRNAPAYILVRTNDYFPWFGYPSSKTLIARDPEFQAFIRTKYVFEGFFRQYALLYHRITP
jgi:hypothetical protein